MFRYFLTDHRGATAIEYALIAMLVSVATIGGIRAVGEANKAQIDTVAKQYPQSG